MPNFSAVITADIVNYTRLSKADEKKLITVLSSLLKEHKFEFYRGDSFQVYVPDPSKALRIILQLRSLAIRLNGTATFSVDIRSSIAIGFVKSRVKKLQTASDEAFVLSGRSFDAMRMGQRLVISCNKKNAAAGYGLEILAGFIDYLFHDLTAKQAHVVHELLKGKNQLEVAHFLKKSQATVHKHVKAAGWPEMEKLLTQYVQLVKTIES